MFGDLLAMAFLASVLLVPLTLRAGGCRVGSLFVPPKNQSMHLAYAFVLATQGVAAVLWLSAKLRVIGEPVLLWATLLFLGYFWVRAVTLVYTRKLA
jgi:hypothetical protein